MRVLYFSRDYTTHDRRFLDRIARASHEVRFLRLEDDGIPYEKRPLPAGVVPVPWSGGTTPQPSLESRMRLVPELERVLDRERPDVVHAGPVPSCAFLVALCGVRPLVAMSWGSDLLIEARRDELVSWEARFALERSAVALGDCEAVGGILRSHLPAERVFVFPWGVDVGAFRPAGGRSAIRESLGWSGSTVVLSSRTWAPGYGVEVVLEAFRRARASEPGLRLALLGGGPLAGEVDAFVRGHGLGPFVCRPGIVPEEDLPEWFACADLYASASPSDGTSISLLQALAAGLVSVVADSPGNREWIEDGRQGLVVPAGDVDAFAEALVRAARAGPSWRATVARSARSVACERADWDRNSSALLDAYRTALDRGTA